MKLYINCLIIFAYSISVTSQVNKAPFFNEYFISINRTNVADDQTMNDFGFGVAGLHIFRQGKSLQLTLGLAFNITNQVKNKEYWGHFGGAKNIDNRLTGLSTPFGIRYLIGNNTKGFVETGIYWELVLDRRRKGLASTFLPKDGIWTSSNYYFTSHQIGQDIFYSTFIGLGIKIPALLNGIIIKTNYHFAFNHKDLGYGGKLLQRYFQLNVGVRI